MEPEAAAHPPALTRKETRLARLVAAGLSDAEIGGRLATDAASVQAELRDLVLKLRIRSRTELALLTARWPARTDRHAGDG